jgi:hypothetical protein
MERVGCLTHGGQVIFERQLRVELLIRDHFIWIVGLVYESERQPVAEYSNGSLSGYPMTGDQR